MKYGDKASFTLKALSVFVSLVLIKTLYAWLVVSIGIMLFFGGWLATLLERRLYCSDLRMETFIFAAKEYVHDMGQEGAAAVMSEVAPKWWIKLMPYSWQRKLREKLSSILLPPDRVDGNNPT